MRHCSLAHNLHDACHRRIWYSVLSCVNLLVGQTVSFDVQGGLLSMLFPKPHYKVVFIAFLRDERSTVIKIMPYDYKVKFNIKFHLNLTIILIFKYFEYHSFYIESKGDVEPVPPKVLPTNAAKE